MAIVKTEITITSTNDTYMAPGDLSIQQIKDNYADVIPGLRNMVGVTSVRTVDGQEIRSITFSPQTGSKG